MDDAAAAPRKELATLFECIEIADRIGDMDLLGYLIRIGGDLVAASNDPSARQRFDRFEQVLRRGLDHERVHGVGSLLQRDDPFVTGCLRSARALGLEHRLSPGYRAA